GLNISASAPGKVILYGEHAVVYGKLALAASLGLRTKAYLQENCKALEDNCINLELKSFNINTQLGVKVFLEESDFTYEKNAFSWDLPELINQKVLEQKIDTYLQTLDILKSLDNNSPLYLSLKTFLFLTTGILGSLDIKIPTLDVQINSELTISAGTGSSASYAVTLAALLVHYARLKSRGKNNVSKNGYKAYNFGDFDDKSFDHEDLEIISKWGLHAEKIIHGTPSGIDNTICTFGSMVEFRKGAPLKLLKINKNLKILLVNSKIPRNTKKMVAGVADLCQNQQNITCHILDAIEEVSKNFIRYVSQNNDNDDNLYQRFFELCDLNHNLLSALGVSHVKLEKIRKICLKHGLHGKLTGAGGGGYFFTFIPPKYAQGTLETLIQILHNKGFDANIVELGGTGVEIN
ncbi:unnamed protein product, partial [Brassicogethes aeneus]